MLNDLIKPRAIHTYKIPVFCIYSMYMYLCVHVSCCGVFFSVLLRISQNISIIIGKLHAFIPHALPMTHSGYRTVGLHTEH